MTRQCIFGFGRGVVAREVTHPVIDKIYLQCLLDALNARDVDGVNIVPTIAIELIVNHGVSQHKLNLTFGHTRLELVDHGLSNNITLLHCDTVYTRELVGGASTQREQDGHCAE